MTAMLAGAILTGINCCILIFQGVMMWRNDQRARRGAPIGTEGTHHAS